MTTLEKSLIAVVTQAGSWAEAPVEWLKSAGARVRVCPPDATLFSILTALDYDAILIAVDSGSKAIARALQEEPKLRAVPAALLLDPAGLPNRPTSLTTIRSNDPAEVIAAVELLVLARETTRIDSIPPSAPGSAPAKVAPARRALESGFHDMRMLLGIVVGYGANLRDGADGVLTDAQRANVMKMMEAAGDAAVLLEHAITASRTAGLSIPAMDPVSKARTHLDMSALTQSVVRMFAKGAEQRNVELAHASTAPIWLWGNAVHLKQITANLVANALKFAPIGGRVRVSVRMVNATHAELSVADSGPGILPRDRERVFEYGTRLERDAAVAGTGIGLAVVRELAVVHHGGSVRVGDSDLGGAELVVTLPLDQRLRGRDTPPLGIDVVIRDRAENPS